MREEADKVMNLVRDRVDVLISVMIDLGRSERFRAAELRDIYLDIYVSEPPRMPTFDPEVALTWDYLFSFKDQARAYLNRGKRQNREKIKKDRVLRIREALTALSLVDNLPPVGDYPNQWIEFLDVAITLWRSKLSFSPAVEHGPATFLLPSHTGISQALNQALTPLKWIGRQQDVELLLQHLLKPGTASSIVIFGPPGIGKTALAHEVANNHVLRERFGNRISEATFEHIHEVGEFQKSLLASLQLFEISGNFREDVSRLAGEPRLLLLDNLETPLEADPVGVEQTLAMLGALPQVEIVATIRGAIIPRSPAWTLRHELKPLTFESAKQLFLELASTIDPGDPDLEDMLVELAGLPLAIELVASEARGFFTIAPVLDEWKRIGSALAHLSNTAASKLTSLDYSLELSLQSPHRHGETKRLLAVIADLANGADFDLLRLIFGDAVFASTRDAVGCGLAFQREGRFDLLPPIRRFISKRHIPSEVEIHLIIDFYFRSLRYFSEESCPVSLEKLERFFIDEIKNIETAMCWGLFRLDEAEFLDNLSRIHPLSEKLLRMPNLPAANVRMSKIAHDLIQNVALRAFERGDWQQGLRCDFLASDFQDNVNRLMSHHTREALTEAFEAAMLTSDLGIKNQLLDFYNEMSGRFEQINGVKVEQWQLAGLRDSTSDAERLIALCLDTPLEEIIDPNFAPSGRTETVIVEQIITNGNSRDLLTTKERFNDIRDRLESYRYLDNYVIRRHVEFSTELLSGCQSQRHKDVEVDQLAMIDQYRAVLGPLSPHTVGALANLASLYNAQDRHHEVVDLLINVTSTTNGDEIRSSSTFSWRDFELGNAYTKIGRLEEGRYLLSRALNHDDHFFGPESSQAISAATALSENAIAMGRFDDASRLFQRLLTAAQDQSLEKLYALYNLASANSSLGRYRSAESMFEQALATALILGPETQPWQTAIELRLVQIDCSLGRDALSPRHSKFRADSLQRFPDLDPGERAFAYYLLAQQYTVVGDWEMAHQALLHSRQIYASLSGSRRDSSFVVDATIAELCLTGEVGLDAAPFIARANGFFRLNRQTNALHAAEIHLVESLYLAALDRFDAAGHLLEIAHGLLQSCVPQDHPMVAFWLAVHGVLQVRRGFPTVAAGNFSDAEGIYTRCSILQNQRRFRWLRKQASDLRGETRGISI